MGDDSLCVIESLFTFLWHQEKASIGRLRATLLEKLQRASVAESSVKQLEGENKHLLKSLTKAEEQLLQLQQDIDKLLNDNEYVFVFECPCLAVIDFCAACFPCIMRLCTPIGFDVEFRLLWLCFSVFVSFM